MRLKTQLGFSFAVMGVIMLLLGGFTVWGGGKLLGIFSNSLQDMEKVSQVRSLQVLLTRQKASLDSYFLLGDSAELERFQELRQIVESRIEELQSAAPRDKDIAQLDKQYAAVLDTAQSIIKIYTQNKQALALKEATDKLLPQVTTFLGKVSNIETRLAEEVKTTHQMMKRLIAWGSPAVMGLAFLGAMAGVFFGFGTLRTVSRSLRVLKEGTTAFGRGEWDYRIKLDVRNELGDLAKSFNDMAQSIKQLETQNIHMHRMSAVGQLAGGVAHEINNPLTGVLGQAQLLLDKMTSEDPRRSHLEKIERAALRCRRIVRSLLDFSRQKEAQFDLINVIDTLESTLDLCETDLQGSHVTVIKNFELKVPPVEGNSSQLQQVFLNIITNSIQAMPKGGNVTVTTSLVHVPLQNKDSVPAVEIRFSDQGVGILTEHVEHLFEPFFTTKEIGKGTGLGLSVSLGIVRNHGGDIRAESQGPGRGATFRVYLPLPGAGGAGDGVMAPKARFIHEADTRY